MSIVFSPFVPWPVLWCMLALVIVIGIFSMIRHLRDAALRALGGVMLLAALANPLLLREERQQLSTIVPVLVDRSQSQQIPERVAATDAALAKLKDNLSRFPAIEPRYVEITEPEDASIPSTRLFSALADATANVAPSRIGAAIFLTDGQIHDLPGSGQNFGFTAPLHGLITGRADEFDRRIEIIRAPRFGIVNKEQQLTFRVVDDGPPSGEPAPVTIRLNGTELAGMQVTAGQNTDFTFKIPRAGNNILELAVATVPGEITAANNKTVYMVDGIRENMRVLLVSGEPHAGERAWRNLLKSDASVDLVHFTILRPPEKQDGTPINELSLIGFPFEELFGDKIDNFDLIIFDRYQNRSVFPSLYYDYITQYVEKGGAFLVAAGPEHASQASIAATPLASILPAAPTGEMIEKAFYPRLSEQGQKHPVTRDLEGTKSEPPRWGRWFRSVDVDQPAGETVMVGADNHPLLVLNRFKQGRVAMLLSDQGWLWSRDFEGGGPYVSLYRRIAHWLMKEPSLEEEALTARAFGQTLQIQRQTINTDPGPATVRSPSGQTSTLTLVQTEPGLYKAEQKMRETGLYEIRNGELSTLVHLGAVDAPEFKAMISTPDTLAPLAEKTKGLVARVVDANNVVTVPPVLPVRGQVRIAERDRMNIHMSDETVLKSLDTIPLLGGFAGISILLLAFGSMWWREGR